MAINLDAANPVSVLFIEILLNPLFLPGITSIFIMCIGIIRNNSLIGKFARAEV